MGELGLILIHKKFLFIHFLVPVCSLPVLGLLGSILNRTASIEYLSIQVFD